MSTSTNQQQMLKHVQMIIANEDTDLRDYEKSLLLWSTVNSCAAVFLKIPFIENMSNYLPKIEPRFRPNPIISVYVLSKASNSLKRFGYAC